MHRKTIEKIFHCFQTNENGLSRFEVQKRLEKYGLNELKIRKRTPMIFQFFLEFKDLMVMILLAAVIISYVSGEKTDAGVILFIVVLNALIGFIQKYKAEKALEALKKLVSPHAKVIREGKEIEIEAKNLVPGDILILNEGDKVSADARLIETYELKISEATLTGESTPVRKQTEAIDKEHLHLDEHENIAFMGTLIIGGNGKGVVINTGMNTQFGKIAHLTTTTEKDKSPLEKELFRIGIFVGKITIAISTLLFALGFFWQGKPFQETFLFAVAVAVAAVPEGLPATITIALALGVQNLAKKNAIVKQLSSVETLGSTTVICSDKTGTLTKNEMTVREIHTNGFIFLVSGSGYDPREGDLRLKGTNMHLTCTSNEKNPKHDLELLKKHRPQVHEATQRIANVAALCNNASFNENYSIPLGDPTEAALITVIEKAGFDIEKIKKTFERIYELPFDSERKMMTTIHETPEKKIMAYTKGAPDQLLEKCTHIFLNGKNVPLDEEKRKKILEGNEQMAEKAFRVIGFAYRELAPIQKKKYSKEEVEKNLIFIGLMGMLDPPRKNVQEAIRLTHQAGIKVYIVTGDYGITAKAIAKEIGLIRDEKTLKIITGTDINTLDHQALVKLFNEKKEIIFARVSPEHKLKIVEALKSMGEIVAVTGDGVNDAPALKRADIGVAMGITGTDVSKEAANMILTDDSFATIVTAIKEGRTIYENLRKFIFYIFSCNIGELFTVFAAIFIGLPAPLTAILILAVDLGTDILPAIALSIDPPANDIMELPPRNQKTHILRKNFIFRFTYLGIIIGLIVTGLFLQTLLSGGWNFGESLSPDNELYLKGSTLAFALLVLIQMVNAFNARSEKQSIFAIGFWKNHHLIGAITISLITLILFVEVPWIQKYLGTIHLEPIEWGFIILASLSIFFIEEIRKFATMRLYKKK